MTAWERGAELETEIRAALTAAAVDDVTVTRNPAEIRPALVRGPVIVVNPPDAEFITWTATELTWELHLITGPQSDRVAAWKTAGNVIGALSGPLNIGSAKTSEYQPNTNDAPWPAYVLTFKETL